MDPRPYEHVDTDDLIGELLARSRCAFIVLRPLGAGPHYGWRHTASVDGKRPGDRTITADDADRACNPLTGEDGHDDPDPTDPARTLHVPP